MMRVILRARGLWTAVAFGTDDYRDDQMALEAILRAVPPELLPVLAVKETAKETWDALKTRRMGSAQV